MKNNFVLIFVILISTYSISAQSTFIKSFGVDYTDFLRKIIKTQDGGYVLLGHTFFPNDGDIYEDDDVYLIKLDASMNIEWQRSYGTINSNEYGEGIIQLSDGGFLIVGYHAIGIFESYRLFVIRTDTYGEITWTKFYNYIYGNQEAIIKTPEGALINTGLSSPEYGTALIKIDENGEIDWSKKSSSYSISNLLDGNFIGMIDGTICKFDSNANVLWAKKIDNFYVDKFLSLSDGSIVGISSNYPDNKPILVKLDSVGNVSWAKKYNFGPDFYEVNAYMLEPALDGGYFFAGYVDPESSFIDDRVYIIKVDSVGNFEWGRYTWEYATPSFPTSMIKPHDNGTAILIMHGLLSGFGNSANIVKFDEAGNNGCEVVPLIVFANEEYLIATDTTISFDNYDVSDGTNVEFTTSIPNGFDSLYCGADETPPCNTAPSGLYTDFLTSSTAKLHWSAEPDALKYKIQYRKNTVAAWTNTNSISNTKNLFSLEANTSYKFRVKSICPAGIQSYWSNVKNFTTLPLRAGEQTIFFEDLFLDIYPNPTNGGIALSFSYNLQNQPIHIKLMDMQGNIVFDKQDNVSGEYFLHMDNNIPNGIYVIEITLSHHKFIEKILIAR